MKYILIILLLTIHSNFLKSNEFFLDAISFKSNNLDTIGRCDVFIVIPYEFLKFEKEEDIFYSSSNLNISILDESGNTINESKQQIILKAENYFQAQGGDGKFKIIKKSFLLNAGSYKVEAFIQDNLSNKLLKKQRKINILEFNQFPFSLSGLMILSTIEESNGKYKITPFFDDNLASIKNGFFTFFEIYRNTTESKDYKFLYQLSKENSGETITGEVINKTISKNKQQYYLYVKTEKYLIGKYTLNVIAVDANNTDSVPEKKDYLAVSQRIINFTPTLISKLIENIDDSINKLRYVASSSELSKLKELSTVEEKVEAFLSFWKDLDPSPNTETNEALLEYYNRIDYSNKNFKSSSDGWLTDKGNVYVVYGQPNTITNSNSNYESRITYEKWVYSNNREFIFEDKSGFGDYRLIRPFSVSEKYIYK